MLVSVATYWPGAVELGVIVIGRDVIVTEGAATAKGNSLLAFALDSWADARNVAPDPSVEGTTWR
jgi:hypothetical protein